MNKYISNNFVRVNKSVARKLYNLGFNVGLLPCKANPESPWWLMSIVNNKTFVYTFDEVVNKFAWYNCNNEVGKYVAYYVDEKIMQVIYNEI